MGERRRHLRARRLAPDGRPRIHPAIQLPGAGTRLLRDEHGTVWIAALGAGLFQLRPPGADGRPLLERYNYEHKFSGAARSVFEDREKNIWIGMRGGGLLRLSQSPVKTDVELMGVTNDGVHALASAGDGSIWVATGHGLNIFSRDGRKTYRLDQVTHLHADKSGVMWAATPAGVGRFQDGRFTPGPDPARPYASAASCRSPSTCRSGCGSASTTRACSAGATAS